MNNKLLLNIIFLLIPFCSFSQITITGLVQYYPNDSVPVHGIGIKHEDPKTVDDKTESDGIFSLDIDPKTVSPTRIYLDNKTNKYKNYIIVNEYTTDNISTTNKDMVKVYISDKETINAQRKTFYKINADRIDEKRDEEIRQLRILNQNKQNVIDSLNKERAKDKTIIYRLSQQVLELTIEKYELLNNPEALYNALENIHLNAYNTAFELFLKGQNDSALNNKLTIEILRRHAEVNELIVKRAKLNALIYTAMGKYTDAIEWYDNIIRYATFTIENIEKEAFLIYLNKAELEFRLKRYSKAEADIRIAIDKKVNDIYKISAYNLLGNILKDTLPKSHHGENYKKAIELYLEKKSQTGNITIPIADKTAAISYNLLANYYNSKKKYQLAENNYKKALDIYISLRQDSVPDNEMHLNLLIQMAVFYTEARKTSLVKQCNDRIKILTKIIDITPENKAHIDEQMGYLFLKNKEYIKALTKYQSAYDLYIEMDKKVPVIYKDGVIRTAFMAGVVCNYNKSKYDKDKNYKESIRYCNLALKEIDDSPAIMEYKKLRGYVLALQSNNYKKTKDEIRVKKCLVEANKIAKEIKDPNLSKFVQYVELEKMYNTINIFLDWVFPYIGMLPYLYFTAQLSLL
ncbi:MAG: tetratricopeptide repeat protein [Prevotellaceae bacterium]|jgi:hypothetical protein|nr:tetratricopeptide repeat protein [Prevotellaceae bacterium]